MAKIIDLKYFYFIKNLSKLELLEEVTKFQEKRTNVCYLTHDMIFNGLILFKALKENCETESMYILSSNYLDYLKIELESRLKESSDNELCNVIDCKSCTN